MKKATERTVKMIVKRTITKKINHCYQCCPYFGIESGSDSVMKCEHPDAPNPYIVSHPECQRGFPKRCPLK